MKKIIFFILFGVSLYSCKDNPALIDEIPATKVSHEQSKDLPCISLSNDEINLLEELSNGTPKISQEHAMEIANDFLKKSSTSGSISKHGTIMPKCEVLTKNRCILSKTGTTVEEIDTLLYLFNYDKGFAMVSADIRVPERILAYSYEDYMSLEDDNPGIQLFLDMTQDYIEYSINKNECTRDSLEMVLDEKISAEMENDTTTTSIISKSKKEISRSLVFSNVQSKHENTEIIGPYVQTLWHQGKPYNMFAPKRGGKFCKAGCVAVAFSQLMAYWRQPTIVDGGILYIWSPMFPPNIDTTVIATLIHSVGVSIHTKYDTSGSSAYTEDGIKLLKSYGYHTNDLVNYSFFSVTNSLDNKRPVIIDGRCMDTKENKKVGHCWLIDGYAKERWSYSGIKRYLVMYKEDGTGIVTGEFEVIPETPNRTFYYQHFNWGWGAKIYQSYYSANVFDMHKEYKILPGKQAKESITSYNKLNDYKYSVRIVTNIYF